MVLIEEFRPEHQGEQVGMCHRLLDVGPGCACQAQHRRRAPRHLTSRLVESFGEQLEAPAGDLASERRQAPKMAERGAVRKPGPAGDFSQGKRLDPLLFKQREGGLNQMLGGLWGVANHVDSVYYSVDTVNLG